MNTQLQRGTVSAYTFGVWLPCSLTAIWSLRNKLNCMIRDDGSYAEVLVIIYLIPLFYLSWRGRLPNICFEVLSSSIEGPRRFLQATFFPSPQSSAHFHPTKHITSSIKPVVLLL